LTVYYSTVLKLGWS